MSTVTTFLQAFAGQDWLTSTEAITRLEQVGYWEDLPPMSDQEKRTHVAWQSGRVRDADGWPLIVAIDRQHHGTMQRMYKSEEACTLEDYQEVIAYHHRLGAFHAQRAANAHRQGRHPENLR